jgi:hypothetical protein
MHAHCKKIRIIGQNVLICYVSSRVPRPCGIEGTRLEVLREREYVDARERRKTRVRDFYGLPKQSHEIRFYFILNIN